MMAAVSSLPETYFLNSTPHVPNSRLPVLIYRSVLLHSSSSPLSPVSIKRQIEPNRWLVGGQWKAYTAAHFHSVSHECYAVFRGKSTLRLGVGPFDEMSDDSGRESDTSDPGSSHENGIDVELAAGDIIVLPVGLSTFP